MSEPRTTESHGCPSTKGARNGERKSNHGAVVRGESVLELLKAGTRFLKRQGFRDARESSEELLSHILRKTRASLYLDSDEGIARAKQKVFFEFIQKRAGHYPLQYLVRHTPFRYVDLQVKKGVFIPRPETECLVDVVLDRMAEVACDRPKILDVGTGTGCLAISLVKEIPDARVVATDRSKRAIAIAVRNAVQNNVAKQVRFGHTNYWHGISNQFDVVVSNPPYLSRRDLQRLQPEVHFEPKQALDGGMDGLRAYRYVISVVHQVLKRGGLLAFEVGKGQAWDVEEMLQQNGFRDVWKTQDLSGIERVVSARLVH